LKKSLLVIGVAVGVLLIAARTVGGEKLVLKGLESAWDTAIQSALLLVVSFIVIGQIQVLLSKEKLDKWLGEYSGIKGIVISAVVGGLLPGGPYIYYPFIRSFADKGLPFYVLIAFLFGKNIYDFTRIPLEVSLLDPKITLIRILITLPIPIIAGLLAQQLFKNISTDRLFPREEGSGDPDHLHS
jgi:uncharacterized membrane protein YraQ (UPF0718 family)